MGQKSSTRNDGRIVHTLYDWVGTLVLALSVFALLFAFVVRIVGVDGSSMTPTFQDGDRLLLSVTDTTYSRGDIVVVDRYTDEPLIKRVIAVGGDTISIDESGRVYINGKYTYEGYIEGVTVLRDFSGEVKVPQGYLFIMSNYICNEVVPIALAYPAGWFVCSLLIFLYYLLVGFGKQKVVD